MDEVACSIPIPRLYRSAHVKVQKQLHGIPLYANKVRTSSSGRNVTYLCVGPFKSSMLYTHDIKYTYSWTWCHHNINNIILNTFFSVGGGDGGGDAAELRVLGEEA